MGRVKSSSLFTFESVKCPCSLFATPLTSNCCDDDHELIKIENDHAVSLIVSIAPDFFEIGQLFETDRTENIDHSKLITPIGESPPPLSDTPLFAKHCSLVFYDSLNA
jgi:hypothetical protein